MMSWFKKRPPKPAPEPRRINVHRANIVVSMRDSSRHELRVVGKVIAAAWDDAVVRFDASDGFDRWLKETRRDGFVHLGRGVFRPTQDVAKIVVTYVDHFVTLKDRHG